MKYDKTIKIGNTTIHIVAPPPQTKEEIDRILDEYHKAGWAIVREMQEKAATHTIKKTDTPVEAE